MPYEAPMALYASRFGSVYIVIDAGLAASEMEGEEDAETRRHDGQSE